MPPVAVAVVSLCIVDIIIIFRVPPLLRGPTMAAFMARLKAVLLDIILRDWRRDLTPPAPAPAFLPLRDDVDVVDDDDALLR